MLGDAHNFKSEVEIQFNVCVSDVHDTHETVIIKL